MSAGVTARKQTGDRKGDEIKEMQKLPRVLLRALRNSRCLSAITSPGHACSNTHFVFVFLNGTTQCENCPQPAWYQKAALLQQGGARQKRFHSVMIGWVILPSFSFFFMHLVSVSLCLTGPLYSFSQRLHTEERQIIRKYVQSL